MKVGGEGVSDMSLPASLEKKSLFLNRPSHHLKNVVCAGSWDLKLIL